MSPSDIRIHLKRHGMECRPKASSNLMRAIGWLLRVFHINAKFMERYTTVVWRHLYYPASWGMFSEHNDAQLRRHASTFEHEFHHRAQVEKLWILFPLVYLFFPVPFFFAWGRWRLERTAYLVNIRNGRTVDQCVEALWRYGWPWPKSWMRSWFEANK